MKPIHPRRPLAPGLPSGLALVIMMLVIGVLRSLPGSAAGLPSRADPLVQAEAGQQQLRGSTVRVGDQLSSILEEFNRNGLGGEDVKLLGSIRGVLGQLTEADMAGILTLLREARDTPETGPRKARLIEAFGAQKGVSLKLRQILLEYQKQQELAGVAARLDELAARQHVALRDSIGLAGSASGRKREWLAENQRIALQLLSSEQQTLRDEANAVMERLRSWKFEDDNDAAARIANVLDRPESARLGTELGAVLDDLAAGHFLSVSGRQRAARGFLRELSRQLLPPADEIEALRAAAREVELLSVRQENVRVTTRTLAERSPALPETIEQQAGLVDDSDSAREIVAALDTAAGEHVSAAVNRMQEARGILEVEAPELRARRLGAATQQELALARLATAKRLLEQRIDTLEKQREAAADPKTNLEQIRQDVAELLKLEKILKEEAAVVAEDPARLRPMAPRQGDLGDRAGDVASRTRLDSAEAAEMVNAAVGEMRRSQRSLGEGRNNAGAQQAAIDALSKALEEIDRKLAELAAAEKELAELEDLLKRLIALIEAQQGLNSETARAVRKLPGKSPAELGGEQSTLSKATRDIEADVPPSVPQAATYLGDAATQMILASNELENARPADARSSQEEALLNLQRARRELEDRIAQLQEMLGIPPADAPLEQLAKMIKEAQQDVSSALSDEALKKMAQTLRKAGDRVKPATSGRMGRVPRMVRDPLQQAEQALSEGAAAAEGGDEPASDQEASRAQEALAAAAAAIDLAMAGLGQQPGSGEGQGQGNSPGQGQGRGRGRQPGIQAGKGTGDAGNFFGAGGADGPRRGTSGTGRFIGLPARERAALLQSQGESYPQEYAPMIEQYLKNLSDQVGETPRQ